MVVKSVKNIYTPNPMSNATVTQPTTKTKSKTAPAPAARRRGKVSSGYVKRSTTYPVCKELGMLALGAVIPPAIA
jgi:hypothetical protein